MKIWSVEMPNAPYSNRYRQVYLTEYQQNNNDLKIWKPTHNQHFCNSHKPIRILKLQKSCFLQTHRTNLLILVFENF